jgi:hypothetical protein
VNRGETHDVVALAADDRVRRIMFTGIFSVLGTVVLIFVVTRWAERAAAPVIARGWTSRFGEAGQIALFRDGHHIRWKRHPVKIGLGENLYGRRTMKRLAMLAMATFALVLNTGVAMATPCPTYVCAPDDPVVTNPQGVSEPAPFRTASPTRP